MRNLFLLTTLLLYCVPSFAQYTNVYFQNNTDLTFAYSSTSSAPTSDWTGQSGSSAPFQRSTEMMNFRRGFTSFTTLNYNLTTTLTAPSGETIDLQIAYQIDWTGTSFEHSAAGPGFNHGWRSDQTIYTETPFVIDGENYILRYQSYSTLPSGLYDDVLYAIYHETDPTYSVLASDATNPDILNVMSYNVYMRPEALFPDDQTVRADHIHNYVNDMDAILLQEVFDNGPRATLLANLAAEYPYQTTVVDDTGNALEDGGILIVSKWPIEVEDQLLWGTNCNEDDCLANKGVKYARINKLGKKYHLFATHMDAFNEVVDVNIRKDQLVLWKNYVDSKNIPLDEGVVLGGDFNIDKYTNKLGEYDSLWGNFAGNQPVYSGLDYSWHSDLNHYLLDATDTPEHLDYVINRIDHRTALSATNDVLNLRSNHIDMWRKFDLSDHQAIWGRFVWDIPLSIELISFSAQEIDYSSVQLDWSTASEIDNAYFILEHSLNGTDFTEIGQVAGNGTNDEMSLYSFLHESVNYGTHYYRLVQYDFSGSSSTSEIISITLRNDEQVLQNVYPNPVNKGQNIQLNMFTASGEDVHVSIVDMMGRDLYRDTKTLNSGESQIDIPTSSLSPGVFVLVIENQEGVLIERSKIMVK